MFGVTISLEVEEISGAVEVSEEEIGIPISGSDDEWTKTLLETDADKKENEGMCRGILNNCDSLVLY